MNRTLLTLTGLVILPMALVGCAAIGEGAAVYVACQDNHYGISSECEQARKDAALSTQLRKEKKERDRQAKELADLSNKNREHEKSEALQRDNKSDSLPDQQPKLADLGDKDAASLPGFFWDAPEDALRGTWNGRYRCSQGWLGVEIKLESAFDVVWGDLTFFPLPENPTVPRGRFAVSGNYYSGNNLLRLEPGEWSERPEGWISPSLKGFYVQAADLLQFDFVDTPTCETFHVARQ